MQQQQPSPTMNAASQVPPHAMTTEQIQKCLDDNKNLILAILENQNLGKLNECAQYQALLQKNLMYLAAIADAQPQPPQPPQGPNPAQLQMPPNSAPPQATQYMQQPQHATPQQHQGGPSQNLPFQLNALRPDQQQQLFQLQQQQQQQMQAQMGMRPGMQQNAMLGMHQSMQAGLGNPGGGMMDARGGKQDGQETPSGGGDGQGKSASGRGNRDS